MSEVTFPYQTVRDIDVQGKHVLVRADYNVPLNEQGQISDDFRIEASLPTLKYLLARHAKVVVMSHLGRPKSAADKQFSLAPVARALAAKLDITVRFLNDCIGEEVQHATAKQTEGEIILLENLRFHKEEKANDPAFAKALATDTHAEVFVQDGFGVVHRAHASTASITEYLPAVAGLLLEREYVAIKQAIDQPRRPMTAIIGGAKISDKIPLVKKFIETADNVVVGGALANNFLKHLGYNVGASLVEDGVDDIVADILQLAHDKYGDAFDEKFILPRDVAIAANGSLDDPRREVGLDQVSGANVIYDLGEKTINVIDRLVASSGTVIWNGTLGMAERQQFAHGSARLAMSLARDPKITSVIGGGDTADFVRNWDSKRGGSFTHVSTGGGASLELMSGQTLPGIAALLWKL